MTHKENDYYASALIQLLQKPDEFSAWHTKFITKEVDWNHIYQLLIKGLILRRVVSLFKNNNAPLPEFFYKSDEVEKKRITDTIDVMAKLSQICQTNNIPHVYTKAFQHFPDMGHDIDLLVCDPHNKIIKLVQDQFNVSPDKQTLTNRLSNKVGFELRPDIPLEIHIGRTGHIGEHVDYVRLLMERSLSIDCHGYKFPIPSSEDRVIIQVMQRLFGHFRFRLSDVINGLQIIDNKELDWNYINQTAKSLGISKGKSYYFKAMHAFAQGDYSLECKSNGYQLSLVSCILPAYSAKFFANLIKGKLSTALRLTLIPLLGLLTLVKLILRKLSSQ